MGRLFFVLLGFFTALLCFVRVVLCGAVTAFSLRCGMTMGSQVGGISKGRGCVPLHAINSKINRSEFLQRFNQSSIVDMSVWHLNCQTSVYQKQSKMKEQFSETHHKIVSGLGTLLSHLNADSGTMAIVMSWGDTQDSEETLSALNDYIKNYIETNNQPPRQ